MISIADAAAVCGVTRSAVYQWVRAGRLQLEATDTGRSMVAEAAARGCAASARHGRKPKVIARQARRRRKILALVKRRPDANAFQIAEVLGVVVPTAAADLSALVAAGELVLDPAAGWVVPG